jgi:hypothetical protein
MLKEQLLSYDDSVNFLLDLSRYINSSIVLSNIIEKEEENKMKGKNNKVVRRLNSLLDLGSEVNFAKHSFFYSDETIRDKDSGMNDIFI